MSDSFWLDTKRRMVRTAMGGNAQSYFELRPDCYIEEKINSNLSYIGRAMGTTDETVACWQIIRLTKDAGFTKYEICGSGMFEYKWSDRITLFSVSGALATPVLDDTTVAVNAIGASIVNAIAARIPVLQFTGTPRKTVIASLKENQSYLLAAANPNRKGFTIYNNSISSLYICVETPAVAANLIDFCGSNAGPASVVKWLGSGVPTCALYGIRNAGTGGVCTWEFE